MKSVSKSFKQTADHPLVAPTIRADGSKAWYRHGLRHREDGPAIEWVDGFKEWYRDGKRHRDGGPAVECANGTKVWYRNDLLHREDGPAIEYACGGKEWYRNGQQLTAQEIAASEVQPSNKAVAVSLLIRLTFKL